MKIPNVEKALEGRSDGSTAKELMKLAEKDPMHHIELELSDALKRAYEEAKENGFEGTITDYINRTPVEELKKILGTENVACVIDAKHLCVNSRGIRDISSSTVTAEFGGVFKDKEKKREFLDYIKLETEF